MNQFELKQSITDLGFQHFTPACSTWRDAFIFQFDKHVLVLLIRARGVDFRYYSDFNNQVFLNNNGKVSLNEGLIIRNGYGQVSFNVHDHALRVASLFSCKEIDSCIAEVPSLQLLAM